MLLNLIELKNKYNFNIKGVIHVGAHFGEEHQIYKQLNIKNIVYFEPVKKTFNILKENVKNEAQIFNYALGNENKFIDMYIEKMDAYGCSSILKPSTNYSTEIFDGKETVEMKKLDDCKIQGDFNFLNVDVQGYELEVFKGANNILENIDYIICEVNRITPHKKLDYENASLVEDLREFLFKKSFDLVEINWAGISWGDALFIKR